MSLNMMLNIEQLSFWERKEYFEQIDFLVIGAGIVGCSTAFHLKKRFPNAKIIVVERGVLPCGASTKNAGFASFGGPVELLDDLKNTDNTTVWDTVQARYEGLIQLRELIGDKAMDFQQNGGWDLIIPSKSKVAAEVQDQLTEMNLEMKRITGNSEVFKEDVVSAGKFGFQNVETSFHIAIEGQIDTGKMMKRYHQLVTEAGIAILYGIEVKSIDVIAGIAETNIGTIQAQKMMVTVNGFASKLVENEDVLPARAQVLVTSPIENLPFKGTFHFDSGFYYFRNFGNRVLFGGARNLDVEGETTFEMVTSDPIQNQLKTLLSTMILPNKEFKIDYQWSGIMGVGKSKFPLIKQVSNRVFLGVRLGGIGVALGTNVGKKLAEMV